MQHLAPASVSPSLRLCHLPPILCLAASSSKAHTRAAHHPSPSPSSSCSHIPPGPRRIRPVRRPLFFPLPPPPPYRLLLVVVVAAPTYSYFFSNSSHSLSLLLAFGDPCLPSSKQPGVQTRSNNISTAVSCSSLHQQHPPPPPRTVPRPEAHTRTRTRQCPAQQQPVDEQHHSDALTLAINPCPPARRGFFFTHIHHPPPPVDPRRSGKLSPSHQHFPPPPRRKPSLGCRPPQWLPSPASRLPPSTGRVCRA